MCGKCPFQTIPKKTIKNNKHIREWKNYISLSERFYKILVNIQYLECRSAQVDLGGNIFCVLSVSNLDFCVYFLYMTATIVSTGFEAS